MYPWLELTSEIKVPTYFLIISIVYCFSLFYFMRRVRARDLDGRTALELALVLMIGTAVGARLMHVFYEAPMHYLNNPLDIFFLWQGGFVFFGGVIGALLSGYLWTRITHESFGVWADTVTPVASLGYALGRWACFFNGCCFGKSCLLQWCIPASSFDLEHRHPTPIYSSFLEFAIFLFILRLSKGPSNHRPGFLFATWLILHSLCRAFTEFFRADDRGVMPLDVSVSTWLAALFILSAGIWILNKRAWHAPHSS